jgi:hypothetical protein
MLTHTSFFTQRTKQKHTRKQYKLLLSILRVTDEGYSRNASCALNLISMLLLLSLGRYLCWWTISPVGIIRSVVSASTLTMFIGYMYYWNLQFLNNVIINKTKVLLPDLSRFWLSCLVPLVYPKTLNYLAFQYFDFECTWWRFFQKRVVRTKFDIYAFIRGGNRSNRRKPSICRKSLTNFIT